ncbi:hypothetical protein MJO63_04125 [Mycobacterium ulcerans]|uniref:Uncharacterized protein n=2 Tax=Mycobacterium ulcerans TaxID=1809 RepID=A0ABY3V870_MYCUL|nr:hypothetical protein [Mycobacterium ulcerans]EUA86556.1 putative membrane protein [Mycobacterium ulcerans str. Harvey]UDM35218.1 hypothetical protein LH162_04125 [Mycobacterium ulcerans]ULP52513.1 hypothetical protein MJO63_04125 [Mycobacterium ulcerans]
MSKPKILAIGAEVALIATTLWYLVMRDFRIALAGIGFALATVSLIGHASYAARHAGGRSDGRSGYGAHGRRRRGRTWRR